MDKKYILAATLFILTVIIGIVFVYTKYQETSASSRTLSEKRAEQEKLNVTVASIARVYDSYKKSSQNIDRIQYLLPKLDAQSIPKLFIEMEGIASQSGIFLNSISFKDEKSDTPAKPGGTAQVSKGYKKINVFIDAKGEYGSIKSFGDTIENNEHLMDIESLSIISFQASKGEGSTGKTAPADAGQGTEQDKPLTDLTYRMVISAYYQ